MDRRGSHSARKMYGVVGTPCLTTVNLQEFSSRYSNWTRPGPTKPLPGGTCRSTITSMSVKLTLYHPQPDIRQ